MFPSQIWIRFSNAPRQLHINSDGVRCCIEFLSIRQTLWQLLSPHSGLLSNETAFLPGLPPGATRCRPYRDLPGIDDEMLNTVTLAFSTTFALIRVNSRFQTLVAAAGRAKSSAPLRET